MGQWFRRLKYEKFIDDDDGYKMMTIPRMTLWSGDIKNKKITMVESTLHRKLKIEQHEPN